MSKAKVESGGEVEPCEHEPERRLSAVICKKCRAVLEDLYPWIKVDAMKNLLVGLLAGAFLFGGGQWFNQFLVYHVGATPEAVGVQPKATSLPDDAPLPSYGPPKSIKVGPYTYTVSGGGGAGMEGLLGAASTTLKRIWLRTDLPLTEMQEVMLHETLHACLDIGAHNENNDKSDDVWIEATAPTLLQVMRDNPELERWLLKR